MGGMSGLTSHVCESTTQFCSGTPYLLSSVYSCTLFEIFRYMGGMSGLTKQVMWTMCVNPPQISVLVHCTYLVQFSLFEIFQLHGWDVRIDQTSYVDYVCESTTEFCSGTLYLLSSVYSCTLFEIFRYMGGMSGLTKQVMWTMCVNPPQSSVLVHCTYLVQFTHAHCLRYFVTWVGCQD